MWQDSSGCWLAGEELSAPVTSTTPDVFDDKRIDVRWMSRERITRPGVHAWCIWSDTDEDWSQEPYEFSTEVDDYGWERAALTPGEVLRDGWFDPAMMSDEDFLQLEDNDDEEDDEAPPPPPPLQGIWRESPSVGGQSVGGAVSEGRAETHGIGLQIEEMHSLSRARAEGCM